MRRFRGGMTTREDAMGHMGERLLISRELFRLWNEVRYANPYYKVICHPVQREEGEVPLPTERWGNFYGFGMDRQVIVLLYVIPTSEEGPRYSFEIVNDEIWLFYDGWFYRTKRVSDV